MRDSADEPEKRTLLITGWPHGSHNNFIQVSLGSVYESQDGFLWRTKVWGRNDLIPGLTSLKLCWKKKHIYLV